MDKYIDIVIKATVQCVLIHSVQFSEAKKFKLWFDAC